MRNYIISIPISQRCDAILKNKKSARILLTDREHHIIMLFATGEVGIKMKISSKTHYGLQAAYILAKKSGVSVSAKELEKEIGVSSKYLERIMRILTGVGVVSANRGAQGGYYLADKPENITVGKIVRALEDELEIIGCVKNDGCVKCASNGVWKKLYKGINDLLDGITLADMLEENAPAEKIVCSSSCADCSRNCSDKT